MMTATDARSPSKPKPPSSEPAPKPETQNPALTPGDLGALVRRLEGEFQTLSPDRAAAAVEIPDGPQRLRGLAGSGKTAIFARRAAEMHRQHPDWAIAFVFFTRSLHGAVEARIASEYRALTDGREPNWDRLRVFHAWGSQDRSGFYRELAIACGLYPKSVDRIQEEIGGDGETGSISPDEAFEYACDCLEQKARKIPEKYDAILIDEGQDLPASFYRLAYASLRPPKRLYWAYDEAQGMGSLLVPQPVAVFGRRPDGAPVVELGGAKLPDGKRTPPHFPDTKIPKSRNLQDCYRTPQLLVMAAQAVNMGLLREGGPLQGVTSQAEWKKLGYEVVSGDFTDASVKAGKPVTLTRPRDRAAHPAEGDDEALRAAAGELLVLQAFEDEAQEAEWVAREVAADLRDRGLRPSDLTIVALGGSGEADYFRTLQLWLENYGIHSSWAGVDSNPSEFHREGFVTLSNIWRAKGNEAWKVYATRMHWATQPRERRGETELQKRNEALVALTRSRLWCTVTGLESPIFRELRAVREQFPNLTFPAFDRASIQRLQDEAIGDADEATFPKWKRICRD